MKISIITSVYNGEKYIEETLESVLSQRGDFEIEYIVVDASSTDSTLNIVNKYKSLLEKGFYSGRNQGITMKVICEKDNGMYEGISKGLKIVTGDIIAYINSDDFYMPNAFSCVMEIFEQNKNVKWLTGRCSSYNEQGHNTFSALRIFDGQDLITKGGYGLFSPYYIQQEATFWTRELLEKVNLEEFTKYKRAGDFYLWHIFAKYEELYTVNSILSGFRTVENQLSTDLDMYHNEMRKIIGNINLTLTEKFKLQKIIDLNNNLTDIEKFPFGIFYYDDISKKWVKNRRKKTNQEKLAQKGIIAQRRDFLRYLEKIKFEKYLIKLSQKLKDKKIIIYGTGLFFQIINEYYDLNKLNIIAVSDKKFQNHEENEYFLGYLVCSPKEIIDQNPDCILVATRYFIEIIDDLERDLEQHQQIKIIPLIKKPFWELFKEIWK